MILERESVRDKFVLNDNFILQIDRLKEQAWAGPSGVGTQITK